MAYFAWCSLVKGPFSREMLCGSFGLVTVRVEVSEKFSKATFVVKEKLLRMDDG